MKAKYTANWGVQIVGMVFQTRSRACLKNALETDTAEKEAIELNCSWSSKEKRIFISLILFRCAKHSILPRKTGTWEKRVPSSFGQNSIAQSHKMQYL
nr:DUF6783 domain-containing protein [uncultured Anaerobutyricum sp.]